MAHGFALGLVAVLLAGLLAACSGVGRMAGGRQGSDRRAGQVGQIEELPPADLGEEERLRVLASTSLVGDVVERVGGASVDLTVLLPAGTDPHAFTATADDLRRATDAHVIFINGFGLEEAVLGELQTGAPGTPIVSLSEGLERKAAPGEEGSAQGNRGENGRGELDPHVWFDPTAVMVWAENAARALSALNPSGADAYRLAAEGYQTELAALDEWIWEQVETVPPPDRELVTDHYVFTYFAGRYGFDVVGAVIPAYSSQAEPSAQQLAELQDLVQARGVKALFVGASANPRLTERLADDLGIPVVRLYTGSLTEADGPASTYVQFMRYDVRAIVEALSR